MKNDRQPICYGYVRVSDQKQVASGLSMEAQQEQAKKYFEYRLEPKGVRWGGCFIDKAESGWKKRLLQRTAGAEMDRRLMPGDHVLITKIDRGFRSTKDMLETVENWQQRDIGIHLLDCNLDLTTPMGKFCATVIAAMAEAESARKSERQREANAARRARGEVDTPNPPLGFKIEKKKLVPDHLEQELMRAVVYLYEVDKLSYENIAAIFLRKRITHAPGKEWSKMRVCRAYHEAKKLGLQPSLAIFGGKNPKYVLKPSRL